MSLVFHGAGGEASDGPKAIFPAGREPDRVGLCSPEHMAPLHVPLGAPGPKQRVGSNRRPGGNDDCRRNNDAAGHLAQMAPVPMPALLQFDSGLCLKSPTTVGAN